MVVFRRLLVLLCLLTAAGAKAQLATVSLVNGKKTAINLLVSSVSTGAKIANGIATMSGAGNVSFNVDGTNLGSIGPFPFSNLSFSQSSAIAGTQGLLTSNFTLTAPSDLTLSNVFNSGFSIVVKKGSTVTFMPNVTTGNGSVSFSGTTQLTMPFTDKNGNPVQINVTQLQINADGSISSNGTIAPLTTGLELEGVTISTGTGNGNWGFNKAAGANPVFNGALPSVTIKLSVPGLDTLDETPITLTVTNFVFDSAGKVSFANATFSSNTPIKIPLPVPFNSQVDLYSISVSMQGSKVTGFNAVANLLLPAMFSTSASGPSQPITLPMTLSMTNGVPNISLKPLLKNLDMYWNGFGLHVPAVPNSPPFELDLSTTSGFPDEVDPTGKALPVTWRGLFIKNATFTLPPSFGAGQAIAVQNCSIGTGGFQGVVSWTGGANSPVSFSVPGFASTLNSLSLTFSGGQVTAGSGAGSINCSDLGINIGVSIAVSSSGLTTVTANTNAPIQVPGLGVAIQIDQGTVTYDSGGNGTLSLTGAISCGDNPPAGFSSLQDASFSFNNFTINSQGHVSIGSAWLDLPNAQPFSVGPLSVTCNQLGFGQNSNGAFWLGFTGDVSITELPISGQIGFNGLTITQGLNGAAPSIAFPGVSLSTGIDGVVSLDLSLTHTTYPVPGQTPQQPDWQAYTGPPIDIYSGTAAVTLDCFGDSGSGFGGALNFLASQDGWFVMGQVVMSPGIVLGETPFALYGFTGGFGYNVESAVPGATGVPYVDYQLVPVAPGMGTSNDIFVAGVRLGTVDGFTLWGDLTLTLDFGSYFSLDLNGALYVLQDGITSPMGQIPQDRVITGDIQFDSNGPSFTASANANLYFPSQSIYTSTSIGAYATGSMYFNLSPSNFTLDFGGQITGANLGEGLGPTIQNPVTFYVMGIQGPAGAINIQIPAPSGVYPIQAAATFGWAQSWNGSWSVFNWNALAWVDAWFWGAVTLQPSFSMYAGVGLGGGVSFSVSGPFGFNISAGASLGGVLDATITTSHATFSGDLNVGVKVGGFHHTFSLGFTFP